MATFVAYRSRPGLIAFTHTEVDGAFEVLPFCPFVNSYIKQHPEYVNLVPESLREAFGL